MTTDRSAALEQIASLAATHDIGVDEIAARLGQVQAKTPARQNSILKQLFGYTGGIFVFSGICLLVGMIWDDIASLQRVIVTLGTGLAAFVLGFFCVRDARFERAATPLFLVSALLQPTGLFVFLHEYFPEGGDAELAALAIFTVMVMQHGLAFWALRRTSLAFLSILFWNAAIGTAMGWLDFDGEVAGILAGISMLSLARLADKSVHRSIAPFWYFFGVSFVLCASWSLVEGTPADLAYLGLNAFFVFLSIRFASRTLLFVSVIGLLAYLSYFTYEYFADVIGWPIALIVMGLVMIGTSAYAVKLGQRIRDSKPA